MCVDLCKEVPVPMEVRVIEFPGSGVMGDFKLIDMCVGN